MDALAWSEKLRPHVAAASPGFAEEIDGLAEGAGIMPSAAMLLQVRQEVVNLVRLGGGDPACTTFAVSGLYTAGGETIAGQNADLPGGIEDCTAVLTIAVVGKPAVLMLVPAGQISYIGINSEGLSANANCLRSTGWRAGYPRYLLTRLALEQASLKAAVDAVLKPRRASSRNLLLADANGGMVDIETTADAHALQWGEGCLTHSNHHVLPGMAQFEASVAAELENSGKRFVQIMALVEAQRGELDVPRLETILRDHGNAPDSICAHPGDREVYTRLAGRVPADGRLHIAVGPPCRHAYATYQVR